MSSETGKTTFSDLAAPQAAVPADTADAEASFSFVAITGEHPAAEPHDPAPDPANAAEQQQDAVFAGDKKKGQSLLHTVERRFIDWGIPKVPKPIMSHHLTYVTIFWSAGTILFGWLATDNLAWLHGISVMVTGQWLTDSFDGSLGKYRKQGLVKWGFYMDHLLDFVFQGALVIAYSFLVDAEWLEFLFLLLLLISSSTMAVSFLSFAATNQFQIAYYGIGPTEIRIGYVLLNTFVFFIGTEAFSWGVPAIVALNGVAFLLLAVQASKNIWQIDYEANVDGQPR